MTDSPSSADPRLFEDVPCRGVLKSVPADFRVEERLDFEPSGEGEHLLLFIEKCGANTQHVASELARAFAVAPVDVGFAGRKDRHAVTRQWFSVRTPGEHVVSGDQWRVLERSRHSRKLRPGQLECNRFQLHLRGVVGERDAVEARLQALRSEGAPNYFGPQRFGHDGSNIERAWDWLSAQRRPRVNAFTKGLHLSVARAHLFNAVLAARVGAHQVRHFADPIAGDVLCGGDPTGPLWGRGRSATAAAALAIEQAALAPLHDWLEPLEHVGLTQERRSLVMRALELRWLWPTQTELVLDFGLASGQYATSLIRELGDFGEPQ